MNTRLPDHDNHHNALKCPYCNPQRLVFATPEDKNRYRLILAALGMEAEGDPVGSIEHIIKERDELRAVLDELIACKDLLEASKISNPGLWREYLRRDPPAWAETRRLRGKE